MVHGLLIHKVTASERQMAVRWNIDGSTNVSVWVGFKRKRIIWEGSQCTDRQS